MDHNDKVSGKSERVTMGPLGDLTWNDSKAFFVNKFINNLLPLIFNDWFTFASAQHIY